MHAHSQAGVRAASEVSTFICNTDPGFTKAQIVARGDAIASASADGFARAVASIAVDCAVSAHPPHGRHPHLPPMPDVCSAACTMLHVTRAVATGGNTDLTINGRSVASAQAELVATAFIDGVASARVCDTCSSQASLVAERVSTAILDAVAVAAVNLRESTASSSAPRNIVIDQFSETVVNGTATVLGQVCSSSAASPLLLVPLIIVLCIIVMIGAFHMSIRVSAINITINCMTFLIYNQTGLPASRLHSWSSIASGCGRFSPHRGGVHTVEVPGNSLYHSVELLNACVIR